MLTEPAFNALLKTLEEPPPGVIFVLATTDAHKIPDTILSRCQRHDFRKLGQAEIVGRLGEIARHEQVAISDAALHAIARASDGSLRDAQSLLDQVIAYGGRELGEAEVAAVLGLADSEAVAQAAQAIIDRDGARALALVDAVSANGHDLHRFCQDLLAHVRDLMVARVIEDPAPLVQASRVPLETLRAQARGLSLSELETTFQLLSQAEFEMRRAAHPRFVLEMALIEASAARTRQSLEALLDRLSALEARLLAGGPPAAPSPIGELPLFSATRPASRTERKPPGPTPPIAEAPAVHDPLPAPRGSPQSPLSVEAGWARATRIVERKKRSLAALLAEAKGVQVDEGTLVVTLENGTAFARSTLDDNDNRQLVAAAAAEAFGRPLRVEYRFQAPATPVAPGPAGAAASGTGAPASDPSEAAPRAPVESPSAAPRTLGRRRGASERGPAGKPSEGGTVTPPADPPHEHPLVRRAVELFGGEVIQVRGPRSGTA
jgi:DNA polymerase-3 subunit gamma/tau